MAERLRAAINEWREADRDASNAEQRLARAREDFFTGRSPEVTQELVQAAARARELANDKLTRALALMKAP